MNKSIYTLFLMLFALTATMAQRPNPYVIQPMSDIEFREAMSYVEDASFDSDKMPIVRRIIDGNYLLSNQVKQLVASFDFKDGQEQVARYAYPKTYDQKRYYVVYDALTFDDSKRKVSNWVNQQPITHYDAPPVHIHPTPVPVPPVGGGAYPHVDIAPPMSDVDFAEAMRLMEDASFDNNKMPIAKRVVDGNYLYTEQVKELVGAFSFKQNQEEIARYAYPKTYDQKRYNLVGEAFSFSFSRDELNKWLLNQPITDFHIIDPNRPYNPGLNPNGNLGGNGYNQGHGHINNGQGHINNGQGHHPNGNIGGNGHINNGQGHHPNGNIGGNGHINNGQGHHPNGNMGGNGHINNGQGHHPNGNIGGNGHINNGQGHHPNGNMGGNGQLSNGQGQNPTLGGTRPIQAMSSRDFLAAKSDLASIRVDADRLVQAQNVINNNFLYAAQVKELAMLFIFEDVRLEFAKNAYRKTFDPQNYEVVKQTLTVLRNQDALQQYINNY